MKRSKADLVEAWLTKAQKDLIVAEEALQKGVVFADIVCFHAQQCAEKTLKGYLAWHSTDFPRTHVLGDLLDLVAQQDDSLESWREPLQLLTPFAVEARYPEFTLPSLEEAHDAVETARGVYDAVGSRLPSAIRPRSLRG